MYKVVWSLLVNKFYVTCLVEEVDYISYVVDSRWKSSQIQIENMSYERLFFDQGQIMLGFTFFDLRGTALYSIAKDGLRDVVRLYNTSDRHFLIYMNSLDNKVNLDFLRLRVHRVVVLWLRTIVRRLQCKRKVHEMLVCTRCLWITLVHSYLNYCVLKKWI